MYFNKREFFSFFNLKFTVFGKRCCEARARGNYLKKVLRLEDLFAGRRKKYFYLTIFSKTVAATLVIPGFDRQTAF